MTQTERLSPDTTPTSLTSRQLEIMELLCLGCTNPEMARFLSISVNTIKAHIAAVYKALDVGNRTEAVYRFRQQFPAPTAADPIEKIASIAVLPFAMSVGSGESSTGTARLAEVIAHRLTGWRRFPVCAAETWAHRPSGEALEAACEAGVAYALLGSLQRHDGRRRLELRLVSTAMGHIHWVQHFDIPQVLRIDDLEAIASHVVAVLMPELLKAESARTEALPNDRRTAWDKVVRGLLLLELSTASNCRDAAGLFLAAIEKSPDLALAHFGLAKANYLMLLERWASDPAISREALSRHAYRCMVLQPDHPDAGQILAMARVMDGEIELAIGLLAESVRINPSSISSHNLLGQLHAMKGRIEEGARHLAESSRLSVHTAAYSHNQGALALIRFALEDYQGCAAACRQGLVYEDNILMNALLVSACALEGDGEATAKARSNLYRSQPDFRIDTMTPLLRDIAPLHSQRFLKGLREAGIEAFLPVA